MNPRLSMHCMDNDPASVPQPFRDFARPTGQKAALAPASLPPEIAASREAPAPRTSRINGLQRPHKKRHQATKVENN